ncbi:MAG: hypothetical protein E7335_01255 [Clostridiales bacterium]|nr:hypothetical protein [Clostridiales bacterium]
MDLLKRLQGNLTEYQSIPFWSWNDKLDAEELREQIRAMKAAGIGGYFMHARGGLQTEYLSEEWFDVTAACIDEAEKQGMHAWCYDENGWPSGFAGMKLLEDEANWVHYLTCETKAEFDRDALAVYVLEGNDLRRVGEEEKAEEYICLYDRKNSSVVDILNPDIVSKFITETHEKYYERFGESFGTHMQGFFTDEPQYFRWDTPYTPMILGEYKERYGGDILDTLGALFIECNQAPRLRYRYWRLMHELYINNFAKRIYEWCEEHNCKLTGHSIEESSLDGQMMCSGGVMPFYEYEHIPGMDALCRGIASEIGPRQVSSASQQLGKKHVITETFGGATWSVTPKELKWIAEWQYVHGVNQMCQHLYPYSIRGQRKRDWPAFYSNHCPWVREEFRAFNDYFTTLGYMLAESREDAKVAVIHPMRSAYLYFKQAKPNPEVGKLNGAFSKLVESLGAAGIVHHYVDEWLLARHGGANGAKLKMGLCEYDYVVLPDMDTIDANTVEVLKEYLANGGKLYVAGKLPTLIEGEEADLSFLQSNITFEDLQESRVAIDKKDTSVRYTVREAEFGDFVFAVNLSMKKEVDATLRIRAKGAKLFNAMERRYEQLHFVADGDYILVPLHFETGESYIIVMDDNAVSCEKAEKAETGTELSLNAKIFDMTENVLTVDYVRLSYDGVDYSELLPVMAVSDIMLRGKTNRTIYLKYEFEVEAVPDKIRLEREKMGAVKAWFNGEEVLFGDRGTLDKSFVTESLAGKVKQGTNELVLQIEYYQPEVVYDVFNGVYYEHSGATESVLNCMSYVTDIEAVYVMGDFGVYTDSIEEDEDGMLITPCSHRIGKAQYDVAMNDLAQAGYLFFGGSMTFEIPFDAKGDEKELIVAGRHPVAKVSINGGEEKTLMFGNRMNVEGMLKNGANTMRLTLISGCRNMYGPFHQPEAEPLATTPGTFERYGKWENFKCRDYVERYAFARFGVDKVELR